MRLFKLQLENIARLVNLAQPINGDGDIALKDKRPYLKGMLMYVNPTIGRLLNLYWVWKPILT